MKKMVERLYFEISIDRLVKMFPDNTVLLLPQKPFFHFPWNQTYIFSTYEWLYYCRNAVLLDLRTHNRPSPVLKTPGQIYASSNIFYLCSTRNRLHGYIIYMHALALSQLRKSKLVRFKIHFPVGPKLTNHGPNREFKLVIELKSLFPLLPQRNPFTKTHHLF